MMPDVTRNLIGPLPRFARAFLIRMTVCILLLAAAPAAGNAQPGPPQIVSHFVDHTAVTSHFFENMYRALQLPDGRIVALSVVGRLALPKMQARHSTDHAYTWSEPEDLFNWPKEAARYYTFDALVDQQQELHIYLLCDDAIWHARSEAGRTRWRPANVIYKGTPGNFLSALQLRNGRLVLPIPFEHKRSWSNRGGGFLDFTYVGTWSVTSIYSDNNGDAWQQSPDELVVETPDLGTWGADEPAAIQLKDGRIWMLIRTQRGRFFESFSNDGAHWTDPQPTNLISSDSPAALLRLKDGRILLFSNVCRRYPYAYGARYVLHAAVSDDEGLTWHGFREVAHDPLRAAPPSSDGDYGVAYTFPMLAADGLVLFTNWVESGRDRSFRLLDPAWLDATHEGTDFATGADDWSTFASKGVYLQSDPERAGSKMLALKKADSAWPAGAVWNFPLGAKGRLRIELMLRAGFGGAVLGLTDHFSVPWDVEDVFHNVLTLRLPPSGYIFPGVALALGRWQDLEFDWDTTLRYYRVLLDGRQVGTIQDNRRSSGLNYLRIRSLAVAPDSGLLIRSVTVDITPGRGVPRDFESPTFGAGAETLRAPPSPWTKPPVYGPGDGVFVPKFLFRSGIEAVGKLSTTWFMQVTSQAATDLMRRDYQDCHQKLLLKSRFTFQKKPPRSPFNVKPFCRTKGSETAT